MNVAKNVASNSPLKEEKTKLNIADLQKEHSPLDLRKSSGSGKNRFRESLASCSLPLQVTTTAIALGSARLLDDIAYEV